MSLIELLPPERLKYVPNLFIAEEDSMTIGSTVFEPMSAQLTLEITEDWLQGEAKRYFRTQSYMTHHLIDRVQFHHKAVEFLIQSTMLGKNSFDNTLRALQKGIMHATNQHRQENITSRFFNGMAREAIAAITAMSGGYTVYQTSPEVDFNHGIDFFMAKNGLLTAIDVKPGRERAVTPGRERKHAVPISKLNIPWKMNDDRCDFPIDVTNDSEYRSDILDQIQTAICTKGLEVAQLQQLLGPHL